MAKLKHMGSSVRKMYTNDKSRQDYLRLSSFSTRPLMAGLTAWPSPIAVPTTPQAVPSRFLSQSRETELVRTVQMEPENMLKSTRIATTAATVEALASSFQSTFERKQSITMATEMRTHVATTIFLLKVGFSVSTLPKSSEKTEPRVQGISSSLPAVTQAMLKRFTIRSLRLVQIFITISFPKMVKLTSQNSRGSCSRQLTLNYSYYSSGQVRLRANQSRLRFSFLLTMQEITSAAMTAKKSTKLAIYQGSDIDFVDQQIMGVIITLIESTMQGTHNPNPISISKCSAPYLAITNPCIVKAEEPAIPTTALSTQTIQMNPWGWQSKRRAVRSSAVKLASAMTMTVFCRGKRSRTRPRGMSVKTMGRLQQMQSQLNSIEVRLYGGARRGTSRACGMSNEYPQPITISVPITNSTMSSSSIAHRLQCSTMYRVRLKLQSIPQRTKAVQPSLKGPKLFSRPLKDQSCLAVSQRTKAVQPFLKWAKQQSQAQQQGNQQLKQIWYKWEITHSRFSLFTSYLRIYSNLLKHEMIPAGLISFSIRTHSLIQ